MCIYIYVLLASNAGMQLTSKFIYIYICCLLPSNAGMQLNTHIYIYVYMLATQEKQHHLHHFLITHFSSRLLACATALVPVFAEKN